MFLTNEAEGSQPCYSSVLFYIKKLEFGFIELICNYREISCLN